MTDTTAPESMEAQHPLVGRFFHTTRECPHGADVAVWQGQIIADVLLIELCEWIMGAPCGQELITLTDFMARSPVLYSDAEDMRFNYEHDTLRHHCDEAVHTEVGA